MGQHLVPKLWPGETFVCIASGPSLTQQDVDFVRGKARVIAINMSYLFAMWADVLYACDSKVWRMLYHPKKQHRYRMSEFQGHRFTLTGPVLPGVHLLKNTGPHGLETKPHGLRNGRNSGYQAVNLAYHLGASRIVLLGYDMQRTKGKEHCHNEYGGSVHRSPYTQFRQSFETIVEPLKKRGVEVINCTRDTALECFPKMALEEVFAHQEMAA